MKRELKNIQTFEQYSDKNLNISDISNCLLKNGFEKIVENGNNDNIVLYTGLAWKHHISEHFENGNIPTHPNGAGKGATIFTDYNKMIDYLKKDGRHWYVAELNLQNEPLIFEFGNNYMATIQNNRLSEQGFKPCI